MQRGCRTACRARAPGARAQRGAAPVPRARPAPWAPGHSGSLRQSSVPVPWEHETSVPRAHRPSVPRAHRPSVPQAHRPTAPYARDPSVPQAYKSSRTGRQCPRRAGRQYLPLSLATSVQASVPRVPIQTGPSGPGSTAQTRNQQMTAIHLRSVIVASPIGLGKGCLFRRPYHWLQMSRTLAWAKRRSGIGPWAE